MKPIRTGLVHTELNDNQRIYDLIRATKSYKNFSTLANFVRDAFKDNINLVIVIKSETIDVVGSITNVQDLFLVIKKAFITDHLPLFY